MFKSYKARVENQLSKRIKGIRFNHNGEYYGEYNGAGEQCSRPFVIILNKYGIIPQYTILDSSTMDGVTER